MKKAIVAYDRNRAIGLHGDIPWMGRMKSDMTHVRDATRGHAIIMGRKTFESIGRALPNKQNIVITHRPFEAEGVTVVDNLDDAYAAVEPSRDAFIFGGGQIYELAMDTIDEIIATEIDTEIDGADAFFPALDDTWHEESREHHSASETDIYPFDFVIYRRNS